MTFTEVYLAKVTRAKWVILDGEDSFCQERNDVILSLPAIPYQP